MRWLDSVGVPAVLGSRAGTANAAFNDLASTIDMAVWSGLSRAGAIEAVTTRGAAALGLESITGRLAPDLAADILIVEGNDLGVLRHVQRVLVNGTWRYPPPVACNSGYRGAGRRHGAATAGTVHIAECGLR